MARSIVSLSMSLCFLGFFTPNADAQIREYRRPLMGDIGYAHVDRQGNPFVVFNPRMCRRLGPELCSFFKAHEYAHHQLNHFGRNISVQQAEAEADRFAAMNSSPASVRAAQQFFARGRGGSVDHGSSRQRLARISSGYVPSSVYRSPRQNYQRPARYAAGSRNRLAYPSRQLVSRPSRNAYRPSRSAYRSNGYRGNGRLGILRR